MKRVPDRIKNRYKEEMPFKPFATAAMENFVNRLTRSGFGLVDSDSESKTYEKGDASVTVQTDEDFLQVVLKGKVFTFRGIGNNVKAYAILEEFISSFFEIAKFVR